MIDGKYDKQTTGIAGDDTLRLSTEGGMLVTSVGAEHRQSALRGQIFTAATASTGVAPGTALTTSAAYALVNPVESGVNLTVLKTTIGYVSGTLGAGTMVYAFARQGSTNVGGTEITPVAAFIGQASPRARAFTSASGISGSATLVRPIANMGAALASTTLGLSSAVVDQPNGEIVVPPGYSLFVEGVAAGGATPLVVIACTWEETPVV